MRSLDHARKRVNWPEFKGICHALHAGVAPTPSRSNLHMGWQLLFVMTTKLSQGS